MASRQSDYTVRKVDCIVDGAIGWLRLDNQARLNAISLSMFHELAEGVSRLEADPAVRAIVVAGTGGKAFCSGGDISEFAEFGPEGHSMASYSAAGKEALARLKGAAKPTIAMIEGYCLGGGVAVALRCDLRVATDTARLGIPAAKRGLSYDFGSVKLLVDLVGPSFAKHVLYTGGTYRAEDALRRGLIDEMVSAQDIESHTRTLARTIAGNAPLSIAASKLTVDMVVAAPQDVDIDACRAAEQACADSEDHLEATRSFIEKRPPVFQGR